jgi:hypothetical protein
VAATLPPGSAQDLHLTIDCFVFSVKDSLHQPKCALRAVQRMATSGMTFRFVDDHRGLRFSSLSTPNRVPAALDTALGHEIHRCVPPVALVPDTNAATRCCAAEGVVPDRRRCALHRSMRLDRRWFRPRRTRRNLFPCFILRSCRGFQQRSPRLGRLIRAVHRLGHARAPTCTGSRMWQRRPRSPAGRLGHRLQVEGFTRKRGQGFTDRETELGVEAQRTSVVAALDEPDIGHSLLFGACEDCSHEFPRW